MNAAGHVWRWGALIVLMIIADQLTKWMVLQTPAEPLPAAAAAGSG